MGSEARFADVKRPPWSARPARPPTRAHRNPLGARNEKHRAAGVFQPLAQGANENLGVGLECAQPLQQFNAVKTSMTCLDLGHERLMHPEPSGQGFLRNALALAHFA